MPTIKKNYILAIDPSMSSTGYALFNGRELLDYGCIKTTPKDEYYKRVQYVCEAILNKCSTFGDKASFSLAIEDQFFGNNAKAYGQLCGLRASIITIFQFSNQYSTDSVKVFAPSQWRKIIGLKADKGNKDKNRYKILGIAMANKQYGLDLQFALTPAGNIKSGSQDDIADAILIGRAFYQH